MTKALLRVGFILLLCIVAYFSFSTATLVDIKFDKTASVKGAKGITPEESLTRDETLLTDFVYFDIKSGDELLGKIVIGLFGGVVPKTGML